MKAPTIHWALLAAAALTACSEPPATGWSGYAEGDYVYIAAPVAGRLQQLSVRAGDAVDKIVGIVDHVEIER